MRAGEASRERRRRLSSSIALVVLLLLGARYAWPNGSDLPAKVVVQGFLKPEDNRLVLLLRIPLVLLAGFSLPKRGPGFLDLERVDDRLRQVVASAGHQIELFEDGARLTPAGSAARISLASDPSFQSFATASAHLRGPALPPTTDLYWNQGFLDAELDYPIRSPQADLAVRVNMSPELADRITLHLEFLPGTGPVRTFDLPGRSRRVPLDPRWYEAAWTFAGAGFAAPFALDRIAFLVCFAAPFRHFASLLGVVVAMTALQAVALGAGVWDVLPAWGFVEPIVDAGFAGAVLLLAVGNVVGARLGRRCLVAGVVGVLGGLGFAHRLGEHWQFAGSHPVTAAVSFAVGLALGGVLLLMLVFPLLRMLFTWITGERAGVVVVSALLGHLGWHWAADSAHRTQHAMAMASGAMMAPLAWWILLGALAGGAAWLLLPRRYGGPPISVFSSDRAGGDETHAGAGL